MLAKMELERVILLKFNDPQSFVIQNAESKVITENRGVFNCLPAGKVWTDDAVKMLRHWLMSSKEVRFSPMKGVEGLLFFKDNEERIVNVKKLLIELKFGRNFSFLYQSQENKRMTLLKDFWVELHDLNIDYKQFLDIPAEKAAVSKKNEQHPAPEIIGPAAKRPKTPIVASSVAEPTTEPMPELSDVCMEDVLMVKDKEASVISPPQPLAPSENYYKFYPGKDPVFVYGKDHVPVFKNIEEVPIHKDLLSFVAQDNSFQLPVWSQITAGRSVMAIEPYLDRKFIFEPPIYNYVAKKLEESHNHTGPWVVIVTDTRQTGDNLENYFELLNQPFTKQVRVNVLCQGFDLDLEEIEPQLNCDILIISLSMMMSLLKKRLAGFGLHTVEVLVLQNVHNMIIHQEAVLREILEYFAPLHKKQIIVLSRFWKPHLKKLFNDMMQPAIVFGSAVEVAYKEHTEMVLKIAKDEDAQLKNLMEIVTQSVANNTRTAIVCSAQNTPIVQSELEKGSVNFYLLGEKPNQAAILLLTDKNIQEMNVDTVDVLINYSIPKWSFFSKRFQLFEEHFLTKSPTKAYLLLNLAEYEKYLTALEFLLYRSGPEAFRELTEICGELKKRTEQFHRNFCNKLALRGECPNPLTCSDRHTMNDSDVPEHLLPNEDQIEIRIVSVETPNHFIGSIIPPADDKGRFHKQSLEFKLNFDSAFADPETRVKKTEFAIGDLCVVNVGQYRRGRVCDIVVKPGRTQIAVECLETGNTFRFIREVDEIFELPEDLRAYPPSVVHVYLMDIQPTDPCSGWCQQSLNYLKAHMSFYVGKNFTVIGKVVLTMRNNVFVNTLKVYEKLSWNGMQIVSLDIPQFLEEHKYAEINYQPLRNLLRLATEFGLKTKVKELRKSLVKEEMELSDTQVATENETVEMETDAVEVETSVAVPAAPISNNFIEDDPEHIDNADFDYDEEEEYDQVEPEEMWDNDNNEEVFEYAPPEQFDFDFDDNFDGDELELCRLLLDMPRPGPAVSGAITQFPSATIEEIEEEEVDKEKEQTVPLNPLPLLDCATKYPEIYWSQSDDEIKLRISATDVQDYEVEVEHDNLSFALEFPSGDLRGGVINLFGRIATESVTAIMRGLVLVVTLKKLLPGSQFNWPRLLTTEKAMKWLKYYQKFAEVENEDLDDDYTVIGPEPMKNWDEGDKVDLELLS